MAKSAMTRTKADPWADNQLNMVSERVTPKSGVSNPASMTTPPITRKVRGMRDAREPNRRISPNTTLTAATA